MYLCFCYYWITFIVHLFLFFLSKSYAIKTVVNFSGIPSWIVGVVGNTCGCCGVSNAHVHSPKSVEGLYHTYSFFNEFSTFLFRWNFCFTIVQLPDYSILKSVVVMLLRLSNCQHSALRASAAPFGLHFYEAVPARLQYIGGCCFVRQREREGGRETSEKTVFKRF